MWFLEWQVKREDSLYVAWRNNTFGDHKADTEAALREYLSSQPQWLPSIILFLHFFFQIEKYV